MLRQTDKAKISNRRLVAGLNCRVKSTRLYGKPLQLIDIENRLTVLDHIIAVLYSSSAIDETVLGIAEGMENTPFIGIAEKHQLRYVWGDEIDGLGRLIACGREVGATDIYRMTTEDPFPYFESIDACWAHHLKNGNDVTACDRLPSGCGFQIFRMETLETSHAEGSDEERSQDVGLFVRRNRDRFKVGIMPLPAHLQRMDLRFTVDYPEDLYVCRQVFQAFKEFSPVIPLEKMIHFIDGRPDLKKLLAPYGPHSSVWS